MQAKLEPETWEAGVHLGTISPFAVGVETVWHNLGPPVWSRALRSVAAKSMDRADGYIPFLAHKVNIRRACFGLQGEHRANPDFAPSFD